MFTDINNYPINNKTNHISEKYIFKEKKSKTKVDIFGRIRSRIRIHIKMKRIRNTVFIYLLKILIGSIFNGKITLCGQLISEYWSDIGPNHFPVLPVLKIRFIFIRIRILL